MLHDCSHARNEDYKFGKFLPGMVLTVEPGFYFQTDDLTVPAKYRGIGVRIEVACPRFVCVCLLDGLPDIQYHVRPELPEI